MSRGVAAHLAIQDEAGQGFLIYPGKPPQDAQGREAPPGVADILQLFRPAVQAATLCLPLA